MAKRRELVGEAWAVKINKRCWLSVDQIPTTLTMLRLLTRRSIATEIRNRLRERFPDTRLVRVRFYRTVKGG